MFFIIKSVITVLLHFVLKTSIKCKMAFLNVQASLPKPPLMNPQRSQILTAQTRTEAFTIMQDFFFSVISNLMTPIVVHYSVQHLIAALKRMHWPETHPSLHTSVKLKGETILLCNSSFLCQMKRKQILLLTTEINIISKLWNPADGCSC